MTEPREKAGSPPAISPATRKLAVVAFGLSGAAALIYEVVWTRELSLVFGSTVYAVSLMLAAFMSGLSLGAFLGGRRSDLARDPIAAFGVLELGIGLFGMASMALIQLAPSLYFLAYNNLRASLAAYVVVQVGISYLIMLVPTTLMGATFPIVSRIGTVSMGELGTDIGRVYGANTLGAIAGSLSAGFLLIPLIGVRGTTLVAAGLNILVGGLMVWSSRSRRRLPLVGGMLAVLVLSAVLAATIPESGATLTLNMTRPSQARTLADFSAEKARLETVYLKDNAQGRVAVLRAPDGTLHLRNEGIIEGAQGFVDAQTTEVLARLPVAASPTPRRVLVIGLGTGSTTLTALNAPGVLSVDTVEINPAVVEASSYFIGDALADNRRSRVVIGDARNHLLASGGRYDVVASGPSYPLSQHVAQLYTREFFTLVRGQLDAGGVFCQWLPAYLVNESDVLMVAKTFAEVFPNAYLWQTRVEGGGAVDLMFLGVAGQDPIDPDAVLESVAQGGGDVFDLEFLAGPEDIAARVADPSIPVNTDDRPLLQYSVPRTHLERLWRE